MGDYLEQLATRALGVAAVLRPRPAARFESQPLDERAPQAAGTTRPPFSGHRPAAPSRSDPIAPSEAPPCDEPGEGSSEATEPLQRPPPSRDVGRDRLPTRPADRPAPPARPVVRNRPGDDARAALPPRGAGMVAVRRAPARRSSPRGRPDDVPADEPPPVHVTIGRIEVRAVAAHAPPKRAAAQKPAPLSLDEYLEQRRSGRR